MTHQDYDSIDADKHAESQLTENQKILLLTVQLVELRQRVERLEQLVHLQRSTTKGAFYEPDEF